MHDRYKKILRIGKWEELSRIRRLQCDFIIHLKPIIIGKYALFPIALFAIGKVCDMFMEYIALLLIPCMWRFFYMAFYDKKRRIYADDYQPCYVDKASARLSAIFATAFIIAGAIGRYCGIVT